MFLWLFVAFDFVLFQNFNQNASGADLHNDQCKQGLQINQSRILNADSVAASLVAAWPGTASSDPRPLLKSMTSVLMDANSQMYQNCLAQQDVQPSQTLALTELQKLSDGSTNPAWQRYLTALQNATTTLSGVTK